MTKGVVSLYCDRDLVEIAKSKGLNLSEIFQEAIKAAVLTDIDTEKSAENQKKDVQLEIAKLQGKISALKAKDIGLEKQAEMEWEKKYGLDKGKTLKVDEVDTDDES